MSSENRRKTRRRVGWPNNIGKEQHDRVVNARCVRDGGDKWRNGTKKKIQDDLQHDTPCTIFILKNLGSRHFVDTQYIIGIYML